MKQMTLATVGFERYGKTTRRAAFLAEMERVVPWSALCGLIEPVYPKPGNGRPPVGVERMLRIYFLQHWFNLADPAVEDALYDSVAMRRFVGIDLGREPVPDETTVCRFRHRLEEHDLGRRLFEAVHRHLAAKGLKVSTGTIVDATIINAPSSTKNADKARDPEMHQTKKGNQWYFGMKAHVGVDSRTKLIPAVVATAANVADSAVLPDLLRFSLTRWGRGLLRDGQRVGGISVSLGGQRDRGLPQTEGLDDCREPVPAAATVGPAAAAGSVDAGTHARRPRRQHRSYTTSGDANGPAANSCTSLRRPVGLRRKRAGRPDPRGATPIIPVLKASRMDVCPGGLTTTDAP